VSNLHTRLVKYHHTRVLAQELLLKKNLFSKPQFTPLHTEILVKLLRFAYSSMQEHIPTGGPELLLVSTPEVGGKKIGIAILNLEPIRSSSWKQGSDVWPPDYEGSKFINVCDYNL
jgi:hypothetical protein